MSGRTLSCQPAESLEPSTVADRDTSIHPQLKDLRSPSFCMPVDVPNTVVIERQPSSAPEPSGTVEQK